MLETVWYAGRTPVFVSRRFQEYVDSRSHDPLAASWDVTHLNLRDPVGAIARPLPLPASSPPAPAPIALLDEVAERPREFVGARPVGGDRTPSSPP